MSVPVRFLVGRQLYLRPLEASDMPACQVWINDPEIRPFIANVRPMDGVAEAGWHASHDRRPLPAEIHLGIVLDEGDQLIGTTGFVRLDWLNRTGTTGTLIGDARCWGKGYGTEAKALILEYAFLTLNLHRVQSEVVAYNERSARHLLRNGFVKEGVRREAIFRQGRYHDVVDFGILREDWERSRLV